MLPPLKLVREAIAQHPLLLSQKTHHHNKFNPTEEDDHDDTDDDNGVSISNPSFYNFYNQSRSTKPKPKQNTKIPLLLFLPTRELISDIYRLAAIAREMGLFKLVFFTAGSDFDAQFDNSRNWDCCSISLFSRHTGDRIESMQAFSRALAGTGWTLYNTRKNPSPDFANCNSNTTKSVYLFKKVDSGGIRGGRGNGERRIRELRLPSLDFRNAPLKILQYVVLMADDVFYLA